MFRYWESNCKFIHSSKTLWHTFHEEKHELPMTNLYETFPNVHEYSLVSMNNKYTIQCDASEVLSFAGH
jgi:hypothetical protein